MRPGFRFEQLRGDAQSLARLAHTALQHVSHAQFAPDLTHVDRLALICEA